MHRTLLFLTASLVVTAAAEVKPTRQTIEKHIDYAVKTNGKYAAVRLPITKGTPLWNPCRLTITPEGLIFVANYKGEILTIHDTDGDGLEDTSKLFVDLKQMKAPAGEPLRFPTAMTYKDGWLYVGTTQAIHRFKVGADGKAEVTELFASGWPYTLEHFYEWTYGFRFGKDGWLYAIICTDYLNPKAAPDPDGLRGSMIRISPDGKKIERFAYGLRFPYGLAMNEAGDMFFTDNRGSSNATEELNHAVLGAHYGHAGKKRDSQAMDPNAPPNAGRPILSIQTEVSPVGLSFNPTSNNNFGDTKGDLFIACWGNDGAWHKGGIARVRLTKRADGGYDAEEEAFANGPAKLADVEFAPSGDMYAARFGRETKGGHLPFIQPEGHVYRFIHAPWMSETPHLTSNPLLVDKKPGDPAKGKQVFATRACITCHSVNGSLSMVGPDLRDLARTVSREDIMESIVNPGANIKTDYQTTQITKKNGEAVVGCVSFTNGEKVVLSMPGGVSLDVLKSDIAKVENLPVSIMPPDLLKGASEDEKNDLFAYLESLAMEERLLINVGGPAVTTKDGFTYRADVPYKPGGYGHIGGTTAVAADKDAASPLSSGRSKDFSYRFDCTNGDYEVTLDFMENWLKQPDERVFSVLLNGQTVLKDLDLVKEVGHGKRLKKAFRVSATEGRIDLTFSNKTNSAVLNAIKISPAKKKKK